uniref:2OG-Fe(II) oxygenase n=1 Tax=uncultured marine virus TaxID=186617 RepID=A0A0F7LAP3_9VIRU|nr:hypothetical protein Plav_1509 [uncultured marine virus]
MYINNYFNTTIWSEERPEFVKSLTKASNKYIKSAKNIPTAKAHIKKYGDFGGTYQSTQLTNDNDFLDFRNYIGQKSWEYLDHQGFDMSQYETMFTDFWVQEFSKKGGGNQSAHVHWNQHVSGFYFLKSSDKTSYPIFHEPRAGARATKLKMKLNQKKLWGGTELIHFKPKPGTLIIFPGFLEHEFAVDHGIEPFRFIHWNIQAIPKEMIKDV